MKYIEIISLLIFISTVFSHKTEIEKRKNEPYNGKLTDFKNKCNSLEYFIENANANGESGADEPFGISECVDRELYDGKKPFLFCCFVQARIMGNWHSGCVGLDQDQMMDIPYTLSSIEKDEKPNRHIMFSRLNCKSSYLSFSFLVVLFSLLL